MKLTEQEIRQIIKEELQIVLKENEVNLLDENILKRIKAFFTGDPFKGDMGSAYDQSVTYEEGTYGHFAQTAELIGIFKEKNIDANKDTILAAAEGMLGGGESEAGPIVGLGMAIAGLIATGGVAVALGIVGLVNGINGMIKLFRRNPTIAEKYPALSALQMDTQLIKLIDDDLEKKIIEDYEKDFIEGVKSNPEEKMPNINVFARDWLKANLSNRTVTGAPAISKSA